MRTLSALIVEILRSRRMLAEAEDAAGHHVKAPLGVSSEMEERIHLISAVLLTTALNAVSHKGRIKSLSLMHGCRVSWNH